MKYIDTSTAPIERLKQARENINIGTIILIIASFLLIWLGALSPLLFSSNIKIYITLFCYVSAIGYLMLVVGLILKRELYSIVILIKEKK